TLSTLWTIYRNQILTPNGEIGVKFVGQGGFSPGFYSIDKPPLMFGKDMKLTNPVGHDTLALLSTISGDPPEYRVVYYVDDKEICTRGFSASPGPYFRGFHSDGRWSSDGSTVSGVVGIFLKRGQTLTTNLPILYYKGHLYGCSTGLFLKIN
ncbi:hypothetical protein, partial [Campylobacter jejuni]